MARTLKKALFWSFSLFLMLILIPVFVGAFDKNDFLSAPIEINAGLFEGYAVHYLKNPALATSTVAYDVGGQVKMYQSALSNSIKSYKMQEEILWNETVSYEVITNCTYKAVVAANTSWVIDKCMNKTESYTIPRNTWRDVTSLSVKAGEQKKVRFVFKWGKNAYQKPVRVDYIPEVAGNLYSEYAWLNASCGKKKNISMSNVYGTKTIKLDVKASDINVTTSWNESNFTFSDSSETTQLNFMIDYINASKTSAQQMNVWINISDNDSIFMYYDCNFPAEQGVYTIGNSSPVMADYWNFNAGYNGWSQNAGTCVPVNVSIDSAYGGRRSAQVLKDNAGRCLSPWVVLENKYPAPYNEMFNWEYVVAQTSGTGIWLVAHPSGSTTYSDGNSHTIRSYLDAANVYTVQGTKISNLVKSPTLFNQFNLRFNLSKTTGNYSMGKGWGYINGDYATANDTTKMFYSAQTTIGHVTTQGIDANDRYLSSVKLWAQNNATIPIISSIEENTTPAFTAQINVQLSEPINDTTYNDTVAHNINHTFKIVGNADIYNATLYINLSGAVPVAVGTLNSVPNNTLVGINYTINNGSHEWYVSASYGTESNGTWSRWYDVIPRFKVYAHDLFDGSGLNNLSAKIGSATYNTTDYNITLPYYALGDTLLNITVSNSEYFNQTFLNVNLSTAVLNASLYQAFIRTVAVERLTNKTIAGGNYTADDGVNPAQVNNTNLLLLKAGTYLFTFQKANWTDYSFPYVIEPLDNRTLDWFSPTNAELNVTLKILPNNTYASGSTVNISWGTSWETWATSYGSVIIPVIKNEKYNISISNPLTIDGKTNITIIAPVTNYTFNLWTTNSVNITFKDELTNLTIPFYNITFDLISGLYSGSYNTNTSTKYIDFLPPTTYTIRYQAEGYAQRFDSLIITNATTMNATFYLLPNSSTGYTNVKVTVYDESSNLVEGAIVRLLKYSVANNSYYEVQDGITNFQGVIYVEAQLNTEYYKFIIEMPAGNIRKETNPTYIYSTDIILSIILNQPVSTAYYRLGDITYSLSFNNATNNFRLTYVDTKALITQACLKVYDISVLSSNTVYNYSCQTATSGTLLVGVVNVSGKTYRADAIINYNSTETFLNSITQSFPELGNFAGRLGILLTVIVMVVFAFVGVKNPAIAAVMVPIPLFLSNLLGIIQLPFWIPVSLEALGIGLALMIRKFA